MKIVQYFLLCMGLLLSINSYGQSKSNITADTAISFKVYGACISCKIRIEKALKMKGIKSASWDEETKMLALVYNPTKISLQKIENRIVAVGHDIEGKKAKDFVYNDLPDCCKYRDMDNLHNHPDSDSVVEPKINEVVQVTDTTNTIVSLPAIEPVNENVKGLVLETNKKGVFVPLAGASIEWLGTNIGVITDTNGVFSIAKNETEKRLVISFTGYLPDTITVNDVTELRIILSTNKQLKEVRVTAKQRSTYLSVINPIRTQVMTEKELFKAACCNLSESFETNPSVDVSYNDAVTGSKQIQLLGLSGNYTQLTVENLPGPRGIATPLGLNSIAGPWVEAIQLTKGIGSVVNGYESIAGQINVELKNPEHSEKLFANLYVNDFGKTDINLNLAKNIGKGWFTGLLLHDDFFYNNKLDFNKDGFRDQPTGNNFSLVNKWLYEDEKGACIQFGVKYLNDNITGGQVLFNPDNDKYTTNNYGLGIKSERMEGFAKIGYVFPENKYKSIGLQLTGISHHQDAYFGLTNYDAKQQNFYANLIYQSIINNTNHKFRTGISYQYDNYDELFKTKKYVRTENVPGAFFEYTYTPSEKVTVVAGLRADYHNLFGFFATPRIHLRYEPIEGTTIRVSAGRGQRTANIFAENSGIFVSSRDLNIITPETGKAFGLNAEVAWNKGISVDQKFKLFNRDASASLDFFRNDFNQQVVVDLEDPRKIKFYNLIGQSYSNSFQAELNVELLKKLDVRLAYRYFDVKTTFSGKLLQRPLTANNRAFINMAYALKKWKFDYTLNYIGKKRIPNTTSNPLVFQRNEYSPSYLLMNAQISKTVGKKYPMDFYIGAENIGNYFQNDVIVSAAMPFSTYFDASMVWGPVSGRMFYLGWRFKLK